MARPIANPVELAERVAAQVGAPADDIQYWTAVAAWTGWDAWVDDERRELLELDFEARDLRTVIA